VVGEIDINTTCSQPIIIIYTQLHSFTTTLILHDERSIGIQMSS